MGGPFERLWQERRLDGLPPRKVKRTWMPELLRRALPDSAAPTSVRITCTTTCSHDERRMMMEDCDVLHFVHSVGWKATREGEQKEPEWFATCARSTRGFRKGSCPTRRSISASRSRCRAPASAIALLEEISLADFILCPSRYAKRTFVDQGIPADRLVVCPYGVDLAAFDASTRPPAGKTFRILFLGPGLSMRKGIHYLARGFSPGADSPTRG